MRADNSILSSVAACSTQAILKYHHHLTLPTDRVELQAGRAIHAGLAVLFSGGTREAALKAFVSAYPQAWADSLVPADDRYAFLNVYRILDHWITTHPLHQLPFDLLGSEFVEVGFAQELDEAGEFTLVGLLDALGRDRDVGACHVIDVKSTGRIAGQWEKKWRIASQISGYVWGAALEWQTPIVGAFIVAIEIAKLPTSDRKCKEHGVPYSECSLLHASSVILPVQRTPQQIETWKVNVLLLAKRWRRLLETYPTLDHLEFVPMEGMFHNECQWCAFMDFCTMGRPVHLIGANFVEERWEPFPGAFDETTTS